MELPQVAGAAPARSPLGLVQRGRGAGWIHAAGSGDGSRLLLECVARDPRWDRQVERRGDYYATLALRLGVSASALEAVTDADGARLRQESWKRWPAAGRGKLTTC